MKTTPIIFLMLLAIACSKPGEQANGSDTTSTASTPAAVQDTTVNIVIWNEVGIRDTPSDKGKYLTSIYLGEKFDVLGDTASEVAGSKRNHYHKIKLSDGSVGWVRDELVALHGTPAAVMSNSVVCKRPDLGTVTDLTFNTGDFVVVRKAEGNFYEVIGKLPTQKWFTTGYISKENVSFTPIEVEYAALSTRAYDKDTKQKVKDALLVQLQDQNIFGQSILWDRDYAQGDGEEVEEGEPIEEYEPTDTTSTEGDI